VTPKVIIPAVLIALALGAGAYIATRPQTTAAPAITPLLDAATTDVTRFTVTFTDGRISFERQPETRTWVMSASQPENPQTTTNSAAIGWPAADGAVRGFLRLLTELTIVPEPNREPQGTPAATITIEAGDHVDSIELFPPALGDRSLIRVTRNDKPAIISTLSGEHAKLFERKAMESWREKRALAGPSSEPAGLRVSSSGRAAVVSRVGTAWVVGEDGTPESRSRADSATIARVIGIAENAEILRFNDRSPPSRSVAGLDEPSAVIELDTLILAPERNDVIRLLLRRRLELGGIADTNGESLHAVVSAALVDPRDPDAAPKPLWGPMPLVVARGTLGTVPVEPAAYIVRLALPNVTTADVAALRVRGGPLADRTAEFRVTTNGWSRIAANGTPTTLDDAAVLTLRNALALLTEIPADELEPAPPDAALHATDAPIDTTSTLEIEILPRGLPKGLTVRLEPLPRPDGGLAGLRITPPDHRGILTYRAVRPLDIYTRFTRLITTPE
jgi:hypothetical protein